MKERLGRFLTENVGLKALSVLLAFFFWAFVKGGTQGEVTVRVPVEVNKVPNGLMVVDLDPMEVAVRLRGLTARLKTLEAQEVRIKVDLNDARPGVNTYMLLPQSVKAPAGIEVVAVSPSELKVRVSQVFRKMVPVRVELRGEPPPGAKFGSITVDPPVVSVSGPKEVVRDLEAVRTEPIDVSGLRETLELEVPLSRGFLPLQAIEPERVKVRLEVAP